MGRDSYSSDHLTVDEKTMLTTALGMLEHYSKMNDSKLGASIVLIVRDHLRKGRKDVAALYLTTMFADIQGLARWQAAFEEDYGMEFAKLKERLTDAIKGSSVREG